MNLLKQNNAFNQNLITTHTQNQNNAEKNNTANKAKKLLLLALLVFFGVFLTGCADITYSRVLHPNGAVEDKVVVFLDTEKLASANISAVSLKADIETDLQNLYFANISTYKNHLKNIATPESLLEAEQIVFGIEPETENHQIVATIQFKTRSAFNNYTNFLQQFQPPPTNEETEEENENSDIEISKTFFYTIQKQSTSTVFSEELFINLGPQVLKYNTKYAKGGLSFTDLNFSQIYGNSDKRLKSNADYSAIINNIKLHEWRISHPLSDNKPMLFYTFVPNTYNWYLSALALSMAVAIVVMVAGIIKNKTKEKNVINKNVIDENIFDKEN